MSRQKKKPELDPELYTKAGTLRKRKRKKKIDYFTSETDEAILLYVASTDDAERNRIYNEKIHKSFHKLAENIIHTFKFYYTEVDSVEDLKHEVVTFLIGKLSLYKQERGKAYSYFGTIAKRYLINYNNTIYKKLKLKGNLEEVDEDKRVYNNIVNEDNDSKLSVFFDKFSKYVETHQGELFFKENDKIIMNAILQLFARRESIDVMNKQAFYIYVKEMTGYTAPQITKVVKIFKELYIKLQNDEYIHGDI